MMAIKRFRGCRKLGENGLNCRQSRFVGQCTTEQSGNDIEGMHKISSRLFWFAQCTFTLTTPIKKWSERNKLMYFWIFALLNHFVSVDDFLNLCYLLVLHKKFKENFSDVFFHQRMIFFRFSFCRVFIEKTLWSAFIDENILVRFFVCRHFHIFFYNFNSDDFNFFIF